MSEIEPQEVTTGADDTPTDATNALPALGLGAPATAEELRHARNVSRRSFLTFGVGAIGAAAGFQWLRHSAKDEGIHWPLRRGLDASSAVQRAVLGGSATVATHSADDVEALKPNGNYGLDPLATTDPAGWEISLFRDATPVGTISLDAVKAMKTTDLTVLHKCIEGWDTTVTWTGVPLKAVLESVSSIIGTKYAHVGFATPDRKYYVGLDRAGAHNDQTMIAWKLNGEDLAPNHGAPVRLAVPTRYGIKSLKRLSAITVSNTRQPDFWGQRGYDYDASF